MRLAIVLLLISAGWVSGSELPLYPGARILPMVGFEKPVSKDGLTLVQNARYSYTAPIQTDLEAGNWKYLSFRLRSSKRFSGALTVYFRAPGEKKFPADNAVRVRFETVDGQWSTVHVPLKDNPRWKGRIGAVRFDLSGQYGLRWEIDRVWFSDRLDMEFASGGLASFVPAGRAALCGDAFKMENGGTFTGARRYDLLPLRKYRVSAEASGTGARAWGEVRAYADDGRLLNRCRSVCPKTSGRLILDFAVPENASWCVLSFGAEGAGHTLLRRFAIEALSGDGSDVWRANWLADARGLVTGGAAHFYFRRDFELPEAPVDGRIQITADDGFVLYANGREVLRKIGGWQKTEVVDIGGALKKGKNRLDVRLINFSGPYGLIAHAAIDLADGRRIELNTDAAWQSAPVKMEFKALDEMPDARPAVELGIPPVGPWHVVEYRKFLSRFAVTENRSRIEWNGKTFSGALKLVCSRLPERAGRTIPLAFLIDGYPAAVVDVPVRVEEGKVEQSEFKMPVPEGISFETDFTLAVHPEFAVGKIELWRHRAKFVPSGKVLVYQMTDRENHRLAPTENGKPFYLNFFKESTYAPQRLIEAGRQADYRIFIVGRVMTVADGSTSLPIWPGPGKFDYQSLDQRLDKFFRMLPHSRVIVVFGADAPEWWARENPDECVRYEGRARPEGLTSPASMKWRREAQDAFARFIRHCEKSPYADRIIGYRIQAHCSGGEFQYLGGWQRKYADYSPAMLRYFRNRLKEKYGTVAALRKAWGNPRVDFETAAIPTGRERAAAELMIFRDLDRARNVADFLECMSDAMVTFAMDLLRTARSEAPGKLAGLYGGYVFYYSGMQLLNCAHMNFGKLYRSGLADFICSPNDYIQRKVGWPGGHHGPSAGTALYKVAYLDENDTRTFLCAPGSHRHVNNLHETIGVLKRDFALQLTKGLGNGYYDLAGGWASNRGILDAMAAMNRIGRFSVGQMGFKRARVAYLYSTESISRLAEDNGAVTEPVRTMLRLNLGLAGAPVDQYLLEDILNDNFPEYDCYVLPNAYAPSEAVRKAIDTKLKKAGKTLIFGYAPGAFRAGSGRIDLAAMTGLTGMKFKYEMRREPMAVRLAKGSSACLQGIGGGIYGSGNAVGPAFYIDDRATETLGRFIGSGRPAVAVRDMPGKWRSVTALVPELTPELLRNIYRAGGVHVFCDSNDPVYYDGRFLGIHAASDGKKTLRLPGKCNVYDLFRKKAVGRNVAAIAVEMRRGDTELFLLGRDEDFQRYLRQP